MLVLDTFTSLSREASSKNIMELPGIFCWVPNFAMNLSAVESLSQHRWFKFRASSDKSIYQRRLASSYDMLFNIGNILLSGKFLYK